jgi:hypothetical protein
MQTKKPPTPPAHLSRESKARWGQIVTEWQLEPEDADAVLLLKQALTALARAARLALEQLNLDPTMAD